MALDVEASDVVRIVLQFCKENNLTQTYAALAEETQCTLNTVDSVEGFLGDIRNGRWDLVLPQVATMRLPKRKLEDLYEQVAVETMESNEVDAARALLRESVTMTTMRLEQPERHARLERALERAEAQRLDKASAYPDGSSREKRRNAVANALESEVSAVPPSRLLALMGQALKWQKHCGSLKPGEAFDVFRGEARLVVDEEERYPTDLSVIIELGKKNHAEAVAASPDGKSVAVGSSDGFVELYDWDTGKLRMDLSYQAESLLMMHDDAVLAVAFSLDGDMLASGSRDGKIKVWRVSTGACLRKFDRAHAEGVTCVSFSRDGSKVLSGSFDGVVKIHGLKSGKTLKEMRGHTSFVNDAIFADDDALVVSGGSDGDVRVWDARTAESRRAFKPPQPASARASGAAAPVARVVAFSDARVLVVPRHGDAAHVVDVTDGSVQRAFAVEELGAGGSLAGDEALHAKRLVSGAVSPKGDFVYLLGGDGTVHCFAAVSGKREHALDTRAPDALGLCHHPKQNVLATFAAAGGVKLWRA
jgi:WD40 repeat-containing protein SMU1